ncbi:hypothetical protein [Klebsiella quasipneumoniae]|uniref:hypothetical protein n=1 Tax=Klebsiella quasipneumoniae TaxID=1463165 RepID=UPI0038794710
MTDITELAQREKFEAWFKSSFHPDKTGPYIKDQLYFAWKAAGAEMVEALEKAQQRIDELENDEVRQRLANAEHQLYLAELAKNNMRASRKAQFRKRKAAEQRIAELESRTVTVKQYDEFQICHYGATEDYAKGYIDCQNNFSKWLTAAGIKVEAE